MVADKLKPDKHLEDQHQCGDSSKIPTNLDFNRSSSSDESLKSKSENENRTDDSVNSSAKDESDNESRNLNSTYLCYKSDVLDGCSGDANIQKTKKLAILESTQESNKTCQTENTVWKYRNLFSLSNNFDAVQWSSKLYDLTMENSSLMFDDVDESLIVRVRNYLAEYQELRGTPRDEYTFSNLMKVMGQATSRCLLELFYVILNIAPVLEIFLHILRFVLDKMINIKNTTEIQHIIFKTSIFFVQLFGIFIFLMFIFGFIVSPIIRMTFGILAKIMLLYD